MAKSRKKNRAKISDLKYGIVRGQSKKTDSQKVTSEKKSVNTSDFIFRKELKRNLIFIGSFFLVLLIIYFLLTKTSLFDLILSIFGLKNLY